ncbi:MAG: RNA polymerase sigma factor [Bacteroidota bacterium]
MDIPQQHTVCQESVYQELFMAHARHVRNFLYYKGAKSDEAEDLMQEAFLRLWRECQKVPAEKAKAFLFRVASNLFLDAKKHEQVVQKFQQKQTTEHENEDPQFLLETKELQQKLENAIAQLPEKQRTVFLMNRMDKLTYAQIAERLELSVKAVEKRMSQALVQMRKVLKGI